MPRGGRRQGKPGAAYTNRSDLNSGARTQPVRTVPGGTYGSVKAQADAQRAVPLPMPPRLAPPAAIPLDAPTQRPDEPLTAGLATGAGPGPEILGPVAPVNADPSLEVYQELYRAFPNNDIRGLIEQLGYKDATRAVGGAPTGGGSPPTFGREPSTVDPTVQYNAGTGGFDPAPRNGGPIAPGSTTRAQIPSLGPRRTRRPA